MGRQNDRSLHYQISTPLSPLRIRVEALSEVKIGEASMGKNASSRGSGQ
jgi:hypothetical protein